MHSPSRRARLLLLAAVLAVGLEPSWRGAAAQPQEQQQTITTGQQLADAVASYGRRNADTTLLVPANTTLRLANATFTSVPDAEAAGGKAFSSGTLTVQGAGAGSSVLDSGMRAGACSLTNPCAALNSHGNARLGSRAATPACPLGAPPPIVVRGHPPASWHARAPPAHLTVLSPNAHLARAQAWCLRGTRPAPGRWRCGTSQSSTRAPWSACGGQGSRAWCRRCWRC